MRVCNGRIAIVAIGLFAATAGDAGAGAKENVIKHIGQAMAIDVMCEQYEINLLLAVAIALANGVDIAEADSAAVSAETKRVITAFAQKDREIVCASGRFLYGPSGENVADLIVEK